MSSKKKKKQHLRARKCATPSCVRITMHHQCERCRMTTDIAKLIGVAPELTRRDQPQ